MEKKIPLGAYIFGIAGMLLATFGLITTKSLLSIACIYGTISALFALYIIQEHEIKEIKNGKKENKNI